MKRNKRTTLITVAVISLGAVTALATLHARSQKKFQNRSKEQPTVIQAGQISEKQKKHRKLFKHTGPKLRDLAATQPGDIEVSVDLGLMIRVPDSSPRLPVFQSALCNADAVVIGTINTKSAQLTEEENFIFTDYQVSVEEVIKNNTLAPIEVGSAITSTRDGGAVKLNDRTFRARREDFDPPLLGQRYLLFLRFIPETGAYLMYGNGAFQLDGRKVIALGAASREVLLNEGSKDSLSFVAQIQSFATRGCPQ
jgi:hypothetical protein